MQGRRDCYAGFLVSAGCGNTKRTASLSGQILVFLFEFAKEALGFQKQSLKLLTRYLKVGHHCNGSVLMMQQGARQSPVLLTIPPLRGAKSLMVRSREGSVPSLGGVMPPSLQFYPLPIHFPRPSQNGRYTYLPLWQIWLSLHLFCLQHSFINPFNKYSEGLPGARQTW